MGAKRAYGRWEIPAETLQNPTAEVARDCFIDCFYEAQKEVFSRPEAGEAPPEERLQEMVEEAVRMVFEQVGADFEQPSKEVLQKVLNALVQNASSWGTPKDIVEHHQSQLQTLLGKL